MTTKLRAEWIGVADAVVDRLSSTGADVSTEAATLAEVSSDWWPLAMHWALDGAVPSLAAAAVKPRSAAQVTDVLAICSEAGLPVTTAGGRSGVCAASVPVHGGVVLDMTGLAGVVDIDETSLVLDVLAGTYGDALEEELRSRSMTLGHWPQSIELSTVGGWLACRSAGQMSNRYGKIEDMVVGLDVALVTGELVSTGGTSRAAAGPDLTQLFVGSEGTLGVITGARLRLHPAPGEPAVAAYGFGTFAEANEACRRVVQRGAKPAVLRVYDRDEAARSYGTSDIDVLLVRNEGDPAIVAAEMLIVDDECRLAGRLDDDLVDQWWSHRNDVSALGALAAKGYVVDTMEVAAPWSAVPVVYEEVRAAILGVEHALAATAHQSHAYTDGACLYFTFAAKPPSEHRESFYVAAWDAGARAAMAAGANLSHHHGVGLNRARFVAEALGPAFGVLTDVKAALDPRGVLNPGKLGLPDPFGGVAWP